MKVSTYVSAEHGPAPVDSMAFAVDDAILTVVARLELLDRTSLAWLSDRMSTHESDSSHSLSDRPAFAKVFRVLKDAIDEARKEG